MTEFMRSYGPAMRSNIARTCPSSGVPLRAAELNRLLVALELRQERDERLLLLRRQVPVGRHRGRRVLERALDRARGQLGADVGQVRARAVVAVLADLVAREAAGLRRDLLARLVLLGHLEVDLVRRAGSSTE